jgi:archaellum component FlaC
MEEDVQNAVQFEKITGQLKRIEDGILALKEKNDDMAEDIGKIKDAIYGPDTGIYARLKELEAWKNSMNKIIWFVFTITVGTAAALIMRKIS